MADHDPLCPFPEPDNEDGYRRHTHLFDFCDLIARVRADERERRAIAYADGRTDGMRDVIPVVRAATLADLRAKIEGLVTYSTRMEHEWIDGRWVPSDKVITTVLFSDVLALIDEAVK